MDTMTSLYILLQLDSIRQFIEGLVAFGFISSLILATAGAIHIMITEELIKFKLYIKPLIISTSLATLFNLIHALIPSTERAALMIVGSKIIDSNTTSILSNIPEKYAKILEQKADKYMKETLSNTAK